MEAKRAWKKQVDEESMNVGVSKEDVLCQSLDPWRYQIATRLTLIWPTSLVGDIISL